MWLEIMTGYDGWRRMYENYNIYRIISSQKQVMDYLHSSQELLHHKIPINHF
jgi:hypothetical protein